MTVQRSGQQMVSRPAALILALVIASVFLQAHTALAKTLIVSKDVNCWPQVAGPLYPTIQSAINAMPTASSAVNVVIVCPGVYPEQVVITKNITVGRFVMERIRLRKTAMPAWRGSWSRPEGWCPHRSARAIAAQVVAQNIADLNLTNLTIDGHGGGCRPIKTADCRCAAPVSLSSNRRHRHQFRRDDHEEQHPFDDRIQGGQLALLYEHRAGRGRRRRSWFTLDNNSIHDHDLSLACIRSVASAESDRTLWHEGLRYLSDNVSLTYGTSNTSSTVSSMSMASRLALPRGVLNVLVQSNNIGNWGPGSG
jgi:hypothetical protein